VVHNANDIIVVCHSVVIARNSTCHDDYLEQLSVVARFGGMTLRENNLRVTHKNIMKYCNKQCLHLQQLLSHLDGLCAALRWTEVKLSEVRWGTCPTQVSHNWWCQWSSYCVGVTKHLMAWD